MQIDLCGLKVRVPGDCLDHVDAFAEGVAWDEGREAGIIRLDFRPARSPSPRSPLKGSLVVL